MTDALDRQAATPGRVLKLGAALAVIVLAVLMLIASPLRDVNASEALAEHFQVGELPFDFEIGAALGLINGEVVIPLIRDDSRRSEEDDLREFEQLIGKHAQAEPAFDAQVDNDSSDPLASELEDDPGSAAVRERFAIEDGTPPIDIYLVRYPASSAKQVLRTQLMRRTEDINAPLERDNEFKLTVDGGRLPWGDFDADFVLERSYAKGGHFSDIVRVNLTREQQCWVLFATWPRDYRGSTEPIERVLDALLPL